MFSITNIIHSSAELGFVLIGVSITAATVCVEMVSQRFGLAAVKQRRPYLRTLMVWACLFIAFAAVYARVLTLPGTLFPDVQPDEHPLLRARSLYQNYGYGIRLGHMLLAGMGFSGLIAGMTVFASILEKSMSRAGIALLGFLPIWGLWTSWEQMAWFYADGGMKMSDQLVEKANLAYAQAIQLPLLPVIVWVLIVSAVLMATLKPQSEESFTS